MKIKQLLILSLILVGCIKIHPTNIDDVSKIIFTSQSFSFEMGKLFEVKNTIGIAYYKDYVLYRTITLMSKAEGISENTNIYLNDTTGTKLYSYYFIKKGEKKGLMLTPSNKWKDFNYLNFLKMQGLDFGNYDFFDLKLGKPDRLEINMQKKGVKIEKFKNKLIGKGEPDSLYRYYDKNLFDVDFSFNRKLDSVANSKLYKIGIIQYSTPKSKIQAPDKKRRESFWMFEKSNFEDTDVLKKLFENFIEQHRRLIKPTK